MHHRFAAIAGAMILAWPAASSAQEHQHAKPNEVGAVEFPVACNAGAQSRMNRAVAMLHSFWFPEARRTFESAVQADPSCGVAYWGVALTYFGNPMAGGTGREAQAAGWAAAQKAESIGARNERDRAYIDAALALYRNYEKLDNRARMQAYEQALQNIVERFPADTEAKIFHGIMMVANAPPTDLTFAQQKKAASVLVPLYTVRPNHPGLAHYIIHAFDSPPLAHQALAAARAYANIAPAAPHALHMPSHIFTRLGYWDESIKTNRRSADLEPNAGGKAHAFDYMVYAYLQQGRDDAAKAVIDELGGKLSPDEVTAQLSSYNAVAMPARYALERDDWKAAANLQVIPGQAPAEAVTRFARALGAARSGDMAAATKEVEELAKLVETLATTDKYWAHVVGAQTLAVTAWIVHLAGNHEKAVELARKAADMEEEVEKHPVTPGPLIPARELLGDILMLHQQPADALVAYEKTLEREPNRLRTLIGAARAAKAAGKADVARKYYEEVVKLLDPKSPRIAVLAELR